MERLCRTKIGPVADGEYRLASSAAASDLSLDLRRPLLLDVLADTEPVLIAGLMIAGGCHCDLHPRQHAGLVLRARRHLRHGLRRAHAALRRAGARILRPADHGTVFDAYTWLFLGSFAVGLGAVVAVLAFSPPPRRDCSRRRPFRKAGPGRARLDSGRRKRESRPFARDKPPCSPS